MASKRKRQAQEASSTAPPSKKQNKSSSISEVPPVPAVSHQPFYEDPKGPHLKREVELYDRLSSEDASERLIAAEAVIAGLFGEDGVSEPTLLRHLERRLFRGLASGRKGARLGFSLVITEILGQLFGAEKKRKYGNIRLEQLLDILSAKTKPEGDLSGQEEKDHFLGLLFGLQCFVRAKILFGSENKTWQMVFEMLMSLSKKKPWIREECGFVIVESLAQMDQTTAEQILAKLQDSGLAASPEGVGIWIVAKRQFPDMKFPSKPWGTSGNPLEHLKGLAKALKESSTPEEEKKGEQAKQTGNWNPQLHFVWSLVLDQYIQEAKDNDEVALVSFKNFWKTAVDESLFSDNASPERKFWGFLLFQRALAETAPILPLLQHIFSPNLVRSLVNHASKEDRFLHRAALKSLKVIVQVATAIPSSVSTMISGLISGNGIYSFDRATKSKTIDSLLSLVEGDDAEKVVQALYVSAKKTGLEDEREAEIRRQQFGDYLLTLIRRVGSSRTEEYNSRVLKSCLPIIADFAYSTRGSSKKCEPALTEKTRTLFKNRLTSAFAHVLTLSDGFAYPTELLADLKTDAVVMDSGILEAKDNALATLEKMRKKIKKGDNKPKSSLQPLALLYALMIFELLNGEPDALSVLEELKTCYDDKFTSKKTDDAEVSEVLVEILLSLVSRPSKLLKKTCQLVFENSTDDITSEGLKLLTDVLETSESLKGQQELFDVEGEQEEEHHDDIDMDADELDSDVEILDVENADVDSDDDSNDEDEEENEEDGEPADDIENQKLDAALEAALGTHRADKDLQEESEDSDADMTDSEMLQLDDKLIEIFSQRKKQPNKKKEKKDAKENIVNFKSSVLDLLDIYVKKQPAKSFELLVPLLKTLRTTGSKDSVAKKAHGVVTTFATSAKRLTPEERKAEIKDKALLAVLEAIHEEAGQEPSQAFAKAASAAGLLVAGSIFRVDKDKKKLQKIVDLYSRSRVEWMMGEKKLHGSFFSEWNNWCQSMAAAAANVEKS